MSNSNKFMFLKSDSFAHGESIPEFCLYKDKNQSPHLIWSNIPEDTLSLALICDDPTAPGGAWVHWLVYNIPVECNEFAKNFNPAHECYSKVLIGKNDFGNFKYDGPAPPPGMEHGYIFRIYALNSILPFTRTMTKEKLQKAIKGHVLGQAEIIGYYQQS